MRVRLSDAAWNDARAIHEYYEAQRSGLGSRFGRSLGRAIRDIIDQPLAWSRMPGGYRKRNTDRFPYSVIYYIEYGVIVVVAIVHQGRRPGSWRERL